MSAREHPGGDGSGNVEPVEAQESFLGDAVGCVALLLLFAICFGGPAVALHHLGPWGGMAASVAAVIAWFALGPPPFPGLLPGSLCMGVIFNGLLWFVLSILRFFWPR